MIFRIGDSVKYVDVHGHETTGEVVHIDYEKRLLNIKVWKDLVKGFEFYCVNADDAMIVPKLNKDADNHHDTHYAKMSVQPIVLMQKCMSPAEFKGFLRGNIIKYTLRAGNKDGESAEKDMSKANRYREWLLQAEAGLTINPEE